MSDIEIDLTGLVRVLRVWNETCYLLQYNLLEDTMKHRMTKHAQDRSRERMICMAAIQAAIFYGRYRNKNNAIRYTIGSKEINQALRQGVDIQHYKDVQVIIAHNGNVITVYRNKKRGSLKPFVKCNRNQLNRYIYS